MSAADTALRLRAAASVIDRLAESCAIEAARLRAEAKQIRDAADAIEPFVAAATSEALLGEASHTAGASSDAPAFSGGARMVGPDRNSPMIGDAA